MQSYNWFYIIEEPLESFVPPSFAPCPLYPVVDLQFAREDVLARIYLCNKHERTSQNSLQGIQKQEKKRCKEKKYVFIDWKKDVLIKIKQRRYKPTVYEHMMETFKLC